MTKIQINPPLRKMVEGEQKALAMVKHDNIVKMHHAIQTNKEIEFIYELGEQGNLKSLTENHLFTEPEALKICHDLGSALAALKNRGIVHRDIKPENIFIKNGKVKLGDFGLCMIGAPSVEDQITHIGTFVFMAPETLTEFIYNSKTDIYALGIMM